MQNIFFQYIEWHFADAPKGILGAWKNCLKFNFNYWSVSVLTKTLFSHWRRYQYSYGKGFAFNRYSEVFTFNIISRVLGAILRSILIAFGLATEFFLFLAGAFAFMVWLILPVLIILGIFYGFRILF